jgi:hypothetical protein
VEDTEFSDSLLKVGSKGKGKKGRKEDGRRQSLK